MRCVPAPPVPSTLTPSQSRAQSSTPLQWGLARLRSRALRHVPEAARSREAASQAGRARLTPPLKCSCQSSKAPTVSLSETDSPKRVSLSQLYLSHNIAMAGTRFQQSMLTLMKSALRILEWENNFTGHLFLSGGTEMRMRPTSSSARILSVRFSATLHALYTKTHKTGWPEVLT